MGDLDDVIEAATSCEERGEPYALATVVSVGGSSYRRPGARLLVPRDSAPVGLISGGCLEADAARLARQVIEHGEPRMVTIDHSREGDELWGSGLGCRGVLKLFVEPPVLAGETVAALGRARDGTPTVQLTALDGSRRQLSPDEARGDRPALRPDGMLDPILPPLNLVICGAGPDAEALVDAGRRLGWRVTVADPRRRLLDPSRFPGARLCDAEPRRVAAAIDADERTAVVLMTHDYTRDGEYLAGFGGRGLAYLGVLGPRDRTDRLLAELEQQGIRLTDAERRSLSAPAGLDIGADGAEEVATAIVAEILAVLRGRPGGRLRDRSGPIHPPM